MFESIKKWFTKIIKHLFGDFENTKTINNHLQNTKDTFTPAEIVKKQPKIKQIKKNYKKTAKYS
jgi:uncharacterized membrane protein (DUF106 family)